MNDYIIKKVDFNRIEDALSLVMDVFMEFDAPDYSKQGVETFRNRIIESEEFKNSFKTGEQTMFGAFIDNKIIGIIAISVRNHISLLFVDKKYHRMGIATELLNTMIKELGLKKGNKITLNSSPYAIGFYSHIGFVSTDVCKTKDGIKYTPMQFNI